jgi:LuxR family transcriptional regulator of csgAB operon
MQYQGNKISQGFESPTKKTICVIGPKRLQNEMVARWLELETGAKCPVGNDVSQIPASEPLKAKDQQILILLDCQGKDPNELLTQLKSCWKHQLSRYLVAFFNVSEDIEVEVGCLSEGVRGLFYEQDPFETFVNGVLAILGGKLWLSKDIMARWLLEGVGQVSTRSRKSTILTQREAEIIALIAVGDTNDEIADKLSISSNTVRTHLYNMFKKLRVSNRLQATLWAAKHL